jgi:hypothetical protein
MHLLILQTSLSPTVVRETLFFLKFASGDQLSRLQIILWDLRSVGNLLFTASFPPYRLQGLQADLSAVNEVGASS